MAKPYRGYMLENAHTDQIAIYRRGSFKGHSPCVEDAKAFVDADILDSSVPPEIDQAARLWCEMSDDIPQWAKERAIQLATVEMETGPATEPWSQNAFARYIAAHEEESVDPLLIEAREVAAVESESRQPKLGYGDEIRSGFADDHAVVQVALAALRRGMELAK